VNPKKAKVSFPPSFAKAYGVDALKVVTPDNYLDWVMEK
jgi:hypothetical protein